jgi:hypothetical protein
MNTSKRERLTAYLDKTITEWPRMVSPYWAGENIEGLWNNWDLQPFVQPPPTVEQLANFFVKQAEFRLLQLGAWLTTPDGELIAEAVDAMSPPLYRADVELLVSGLQLAAQMQYADGQRRAGRVLVGALGSTALIWLARQ